MTKGGDLHRRWFADKTYFFKEDRFWRYDEETKTMDEGYPLGMERWNGVPSQLDAAVSWRGETYFFRGEQFWRFNSRDIRLAENSPLPIGEVWFGCPENIERMSRLYGNNWTCLWGGVNKTTKSFCVPLFSPF